MIISCGGTGGHFYPGLSIARECQKQNIKVRLFVAGHHSTSQKEHSASLNIDADIGKAIRLPSQKWKLPFFAIVFAWTTLTSVFYLLKHRPKAVLVMGSFASVPLGLASAITFTPLFLHEGNSVIGRANRLLSKWSKMLFLSFPAINSRKIKCQTEEVGMPIRPEIENCPKETQEECKKKLGFSPEEPLLLVFGGSQGAMKINNALYDCLEKTSKSFQLLHLTGQEDNSEFIQKAEASGIQHSILKSSHDMQDCLRAADLIICRAGASSLAEIAFFEKATLFIPLKIAAENHQYHNADIAVKADAGKILAEDDLSAETLAFEVNNWLTDREKWLNMASNIARLKKINVSQSIIKSITSSC